MMTKGGFTVDGVLTIWSSVYVSGSNFPTDQHEIIITVVHFLISLNHVLIIYWWSCSSCFSNVRTCLWVLDSKLDKMQHVKVLSCVWDQPLWLVALWACSYLVLTCVVWSDHVSWCDDFKLLDYHHSHILLRPCVLTWGRHILGLLGLVLHST